MVRMGSGPDASALEKLDEYLFDGEEGDDEYDEGEERIEERPKAGPPKKDRAAQKAANRKLQDVSRPDVNLAESLVEEIESQDWRDYMKSARKARDERLLREKYAKYGPFKDFILHPTTQKVLGRLEEATDVNWISPIMPSTYLVIVLFMAYRGGMPPVQFGFLLCFLFGVHPHLIVAGGILLKLGFGRSGKKRLPRTCAAVPRWPEHYSAAAKAAAKAEAAAVAVQAKAATKAAKLAAKQQKKQKKDEEDAEAEAAAAAAAAAKAVAAGA